jgi:hypothetical protein
MTATFGDMAAAADQHLDAAITIGAITLSEPEAVAAEANLRRLTLTLSRYVRDIARHDEVEAVLSPDLPAWTRSAVDVREALDQATAVLRADSSGFTEVEPDSPMVAHLMGGGHRLGCRV